jgi:hypothetical protein
MQTLGLNNSGTSIKSGFWARRFQSTPTASQKTFDWICGVFLPVICFVFDPIVFKGNAWGVAVLADYKPFAYLLCFVSVMAMAAWLLWGARLRWLNGFLAGLFFCGGLISLCVGVIMLPFSLAGLMILVGILGFTPFFTAFVFIRNAARAFEAAKPFLEKSVLIYAVAFGVIFSFAVAWTINAEIKKSLRIMENGDAATVYAESRKLKYVSPLVNFDNLALIYHRTPRDNRETEKARAIADVYMDLTGERVEDKSRVLMD